MDSGNQEPKISSSLMAEIGSINDLVNSALNKVNKIQSFYENKNENSEINEKSVQSSSSSPNKQADIKTNKPSDWAKMGSQALSESIDNMEDENIELAQDTKKVRTIKSRVKKINTNDNWDDDPF